MKFFSILRRFVCFKTLRDSVKLKAWSLCSFKNLKLRRSLRYGVYINIPYLKQPLEFTKDDAELLFGPDADYKAAFEELDTDDDGEVREETLHRGL